MRKVDWGIDAIATMRLRGAELPSWVFEKGLERKKPVDRERDDIDE